MNFTCLVYNYYFLMQIRIVGTEEGPHLWPKRLPLQISMVIT